MRHTLPMLAVVTLCLLSGPAARGETLRLLTEESPPFNMHIGQGKIGGMSTELIVELFRRAGLAYHIELQPWIRAFNTAVQNNNTCVYSTTRTESREMQFKWVGPLLVDPWVLYGGPFSPKGVTSLEKARNYKIVDYLGDAEAQYLIDHGYNVELSASDKDSATMLAAGRVDFWATGIYVGHELAKRHHLPQIKPVLQFYTALLYLACNPGIPDTTINRLNTILQNMERDGFSGRVRKRYLIN